jgi:hypothetical protein
MTNSCHLANSRIAGRHLRSVGRAIVALTAIAMSTPSTVATQGVQRIDRSQPATVVTSEGGFTVRRLSSPIAVDGRAWIAVPGISSRQTVRAPNGQFTLTLEEASADDLVRFRIYFAEEGRPRVQLDPGGAVYASITSDSRWIFIDPIDIVDVRAWRRYNLSKLFNIDRYVIVRAISADGRRLFISRQPCQFDCQGLPNDYYEIAFPAG